MKMYPGNHPQFLKTDKRRLVYAAVYHGHCYHYECMPKEEIGITCEYVRTEKTYCHSCLKPLFKNV